MLAKVRHYVNFETLLSIYHSIFGSHLRYACQVWGRSKTVSLSKIVSLQNRAIRIIHFCSRNFPSDILYLTSKILLFYDLIQFINCSFVWDQQHGLFSLCICTPYNFLFVHDICECIILIILPISYLYLTSFTSLFYGCCYIKFCEIILLLCG